MHICERRRIQMAVLYRSLSPETYFLPAFSYHQKNIFYFRDWALVLCKTFLLCLNFAVHLSENPKNWAWYQLWRWRISRTSGYSPAWAPGALHHTTSFNMGRFSCRGPSILLGPVEAWMAGTYTPIHKLAGCKPPRPCMATGCVMERLIRSVFSRWAPMSAAQPSGKWVKCMYLHT